MRSKTYTALIGLLCSIILIGGCTTTRTIDNLPSNNAKGFVAFYKYLGPKASRTAYGIKIYQLQDGKEIYLFEPGILDKRGTSWFKSIPRRIRKVACRPGQHTFIVKLGTAAKKIKVDVIEGMITPVRIRITDISRKVLGKYVTTYFNLPVLVEAPVPVK